MPPALYNNDPHCKRQHTGSTSCNELFRSPTRVLTCMKTARLGRDRRLPILHNGLLRFCEPNEELTSAAILGNISVAVPQWPLTMQAIK